MAVNRHWSFVGDEKLLDVSPTVVLKCETKSLQVCCFWTSLYSAVRGNCDTIAEEYSSKEIDVNTTESTN